MSVPTLVSGGACAGGVKLAWLYTQLIPAPQSQPKAGSLPQAHVAPHGVSAAMWPDIAAVAFTTPTEIA